MAVSKMWPVKGNLGGVLEYAKNKEKTDASLFSEEQYQALEDVLAYAANEEKTEKKFYVEGINCNPTTARQQFITTKKRFGKEAGIQAWHGYLSFDQGEVTPEQAQAIGMEFVQKVWGNRFQAIVTTHLNTKHLHCHFVVNSVSFRDGVKMHDEEKAWIHFSKIADEICREHGLSVVEDPLRNHPPNVITMKERAGIPTRYSVAREAVEKALSCSRSLVGFCNYLEDMGYQYNLSPNRKYWTITAPGWQRPMRLYRLGEEYSNERIVQRLDENARNPLEVVAYVPAQRQQTYHLPTWGDLLLRESKLYRKYLYYCYRLGIIPKHRQIPPLAVPPAMRDGLTIADKISEETRLLCREKLETTEAVIAFKEKLTEKKTELQESKRQLKNQVRRTGVSEEEKEKLYARIGELNQDLKTLRHEINLCGDIIRRSDEVDRQIQQVLEEEGYINQRDERREDKHERER